ncbi:MAG TPA: hypothetical protein VFG69_01890 [Nannocystaceae bacterium]|nr:hypothetical protein [Nannocystaceae bacterium]
MHDLDRKDLVFESDNFGSSYGELYGDELEVDGSQGVFDEVEESELASELLSVGDDQELEYFLGSLIKKAAKKLAPISNVVKNQVGGLLKGAAKSALPSLAQLAGGAIGGPVGAAIASQAAPALGSLFGMELEGLSPEDQEYEAAKQFVKMSGSALENAASSAGGSPTEVAKQAVVDAARQHAPGLVRRTGGRGGRGGAQRGTWYRRGNRIVIVGV